MHEILCIYRDDFSKRSLEFITSQECVWYSLWCSKACLSWCLMAADYILLLTVMSMHMYNLVTVGGYDQRFACQVLLCIVQHFFQMRLNIYIPLYIHMSELSLLYTFHFCGSYASQRDLLETEFQKLLAKFY